MRRQAVAGLLLPLLAGQARGQASAQQSIFQTHKYQVDWEDWPSYFIEDPSVAVCYHKQETNFLDCVDVCSSKSGKAPRPINPDCDMIETKGVFADFPRFTWVAFNNHTTAGASYQFVFVLQSDDRSQREVFTAGDFVIRAFDTQAAPKDDPTEFLIEAQAADVPTPTSPSTTSPASDAADSDAPTSTKTSGTPTSSPDSSSTPPGVIIGGVLGGVAGGAILTLAAFVILRRRQAQSAAALAAATPLDVEAARNTGDSPEPPKTTEKANEISMQEVEGSVAGTELVAERPIAELEGDQAVELAGTRMSQIGMATSSPNVGTISTTDGTFDDGFRGNSPTLGSSNPEVSPLETTLGKRY